MSSKIITTLAYVGLMTLCGHTLSAQYCPPRANNPSDFDWTDDGWFLYITPPESGASLRYIPSPYHPVNHTIQPNTSGIHEDPGMGDYRPEDGWVLVATKLSTIPTDAVRFPQFVLYNRFESKLRYFAYIADKKEVDQIVVRVKFGRPSLHFTHVSAALEHINVPMRVVEGYTDSGIEINVPNEYREQSGVWVMADIPIAYDPCTCTFGSALQISTHSVNYNQLDFTLEGGGDIKQVVDGGKTVNQGNRFANVAGKLVNGVSKGVSAYKTAGELISVADKLLVGATNRRLTQDSRNTLATLGYLALGDDLTSNDIQSLHNIWTQGPANHPLRPLISELMPQKVTTVVPDWIKTAVPFANTAFALLDFIIGGGKSAPPKPMHFNADFKFVGTGTMRDSTELDGVVFRVPGSNISTNLYAPRYDQTMGILNVVEQPVMLLAQQPDVEISPNPDGPEIRFQSKSSLKLAAPLRYALNPASGLNLQDIRGALYFYCITASSQRIHEGLIQEEPGIWRTPYMPLSCLENYSIFFTINWPNYEGYIPNLGTGCTDIQLHLVAKLTSPAGKETAWAARYRVNTAPAPYTYENTPPNPYLNVQENLEVPSIQDIINGNFQSWNPVVVTNDIVVTRGEVENYLNSINAVKDHEDVVVQEFVRGQVIKAPVKFDLAPDCGSNPPVSAAWLSNFCTTPNRYNPILALRTPEEEEEEPVAEKKQNLSIAPNPTGDATLLKYNLIEAGPVQIVLSDYTGRQLAELHIASEQAAGEYQLHIPLEHYAPGIYVVTVTRPSGKDSVRVVKH